MVAGACVAGFTGSVHCECLDDLGKCGSREMEV